MKKKLTVVFYLLCALSCVASYSAQECNSCAAHTVVAPYFSIRSQATDSARQLVGWTQMIHLFDMDKVYGTFGITPEVTISFDPHQIINCLLPVARDTCSSIVISGSSTQNRMTTDWLADYFGLPPDYKSVVSLDPHIRNYLVDLSLFFGLDEWIDGLYLQLNGPFVHTSWQLNFFESILNKGVQPFDAGYFSAASVSRDQLFPNFSEYITGKQLVTAFNGQEILSALCHARWSPTTLTKNGFAALNIMLGSNKVLEEQYHLGWKVRLGIPTGNRPEGLFLFEPIIGNGHHWEIGAGLTAHYTFWHSLDYEKDFSLYCDANLTHLANTIQCRTFDLCTSPASRYMLAQKMGTPVDNLRAAVPAGGSLIPNAQFKSVYTPVANLSTFPVKVSVPVQLDITAMLDLTCDSLNFDVGYNFWYRSCEKITLRPNRFVPFQDNTTWALKGDSHVYGFATDSTAVALSATQSQATLFAGTNAQTVDPSLNLGIDNPHDAQTALGNQLCSSPCLPGDPSIQTSLQPIFLQTQDINVCGARTKGISHSFFFHFSYTKRYRDDWLPYLGIGTKVEFARNLDQHDQQCHDCHRCALSQWALWIKGGLGFR